MLHHIFILEYIFTIFNSSVVLVGDNVSYVISSGIAIKSEQNASYYSSVALPKTKLTLSIEQPLPATPVEMIANQNEGEADDHVYDRLDGEPCETASNGAKDRADGGLEVSKDKEIEGQNQ